jgi:hypothetical protein
MFDLTPKDEDEKWLHKHYPTLKIQKRNDGVSEIVGPFTFSMAFQSEGKPYVINPAPDYTDGTKIEDGYQIRIELHGSEFSDLPQVYETGLRLKKVAENRNLRQEDLHINPSGAACLCIRPEESSNLPDGFSLENFFNILLVPFFYAQSYFEKNNSWPWGQYSHGVWGFIEWYLRQEKPISTKTDDLLQRLQRYGNEWTKIKTVLAPKYRIKGHHNCICGKMEKMRNCHPEVLRGFWRLKQDMSDFKILI